MKNLSIFTTLLACLFTTSTQASEPGHLIVKVDEPGAKIPPTFYGLMTEEISHAYDGGLYAELIQNRVFKDAATPAHWSLVQEGGGGGTLALDATAPLSEALPVCAKLEVKLPGSRVGIANDGYWGIPVKPKTAYRVSFHAKADAAFKGPLAVSLESADGKTLHASAAVNGLTTQWRKYEVTLTTGEGVVTASSNRFVLGASTPGTLWFNLVSVMPPTYKNRPNGMRADLMELMADLKPGFLRFPAGCYLQGEKVATRFNWKTSIGPLENRPGHPCFWGYRASDGVGLHEFLGWCEDLNMEPVLNLYNGHSMREQVESGPALEPFIQDALDEIEYVTGDTTTRWGAERAKNGHPKPFPLRYVEVGNEDVFDATGSAEKRFAMFYDAIKAKYPLLTVIASGPVKSRQVEMVDNHHYESYNDMLHAGSRYDKADRLGPKFFIGEWATMGPTHPAQNPNAHGPTTGLREALTDAAFWTDMERNADLVQLQCYAPLLANINPGARQWAANLICYDALGCYAAPTYFVQRMFSQNRGDVVLPVEITAQAPTAVPDGKQILKAADAPAAGSNKPLFATASRDEKSGEVIVKVVNVSSQEQVLEVTLQGGEKPQSEGVLETLTGNPDDINTLAEPSKVVPKTSRVPVALKFKQTFSANSASVLRIRPIKALHPTP